MSTCSRYRARRDEGFTLVEVMIAMGLALLVLTAALPALLSMLKSSVTVKRDTQAKNLSQERLEQMRDLRFHIDRQNGPFLDLLDIYYTNAKSASPTTSITVGGTTLTGKYVATGAAAAGEPAAPFYRVTTGPIAGATRFTQTIDAQFLAPDGSVIPASRFQDVYDSQTAGKDQAPSLMLGVTVITRWADGVKSKSFRTYTRITDGRTAAPVIQTQGRAVAIDISSTSADGGTLQLQEGVATADGSQSSGSTVAGYATGAIATRTGQSAVTALGSEFNLPTQAVTSFGSSSPQSGSGCSWYGFGRSSVTDVTGDVSSGLPKAPADVDAATPSNRLSASVNDNSGTGCGLLSYDNLAGGGVERPSSDSVGYEMGDAPYVKIPDLFSGSASAISGASYVSSNALTSVPQKSIAGASAFITRQVILFPRNPESGGKGLVSVTMSQASVDCGSSGTATGKYALTLGWWGRGSADASARWHTATWNYDSSVGATPTLSSGSDTWSPTTTVLGNGLTLDQLVGASLSGSGPAVVNTGATTGLRGFTDGILSLTTAPTLTNEAGVGFSAIKVTFGRLTCVADDQR
ncbi:MAG: prepilin-type N-terminal cleavage/methylation domain-containing protein [Mycobacteriales bacterium]